MHKMPAIFIGHGSPMNAIEDNTYTRSWQKMAASIPRPQAILTVSAHWYTHGSYVLNSDHPRTIHDMYGFPKELYDVQYPAKGDPELSKRVIDLLEGIGTLDDRWGYDHGTWSVLRKMYPDADIPVIQLSVDRTVRMEEYYEIGKFLRPLRDEGILILGSGNVTHNLRLANFRMQGGYPWCEAFDGYVKKNILEGQYERVVHYQEAGESAMKAVPFSDHYAPLLYVLGSLGDHEQVEVHNDKCIMGALSMTSYLFRG